MGRIRPVNQAWSCGDGAYGGLSRQQVWRSESILHYQPFILRYHLVSYCAVNCHLFGVALEFRILDDFIKAVGADMQLQWVIDDFRTTMGLFSSGLGAQLTWTLPFGLLIMFAVFNRFDPSYEEAARDLGAGPWQTFKEAVLLIIAPSLIVCGAVWLHA